MQKTCTDLRGTVLVLQICEWGSWSVNSVRQKDAKRCNTWGFGMKFEEVQKTSTIWHMSLSSWNFARMLNTQSVTVKAVQVLHVQIWLKHAEAMAQRVWFCKKTRLTGLSYLNTRFSFDSLHLNDVFEVRCASEIAFEFNHSNHKIWALEDTVIKLWNSTENRHGERLGRTSRTSVAASLPWRSRPGTKAGGPVDPRKIDGEKKFHGPTWQRFFVISFWYLYLLHCSHFYMLVHDVYLCSFKWRKAKKGEIGACCNWPARRGRNREREREIDRQKKNSRALQ